MKVRLKTVKFYEITDDDKLLIETALEAIRGCFDGRYHVVGAALRLKSGQVFKGVNCDGIHGSCAEFIAIGAAVTNGLRDFDTIVAVHKEAPGFVVPPCGNCRQMLFEYCPDIKVILNDEQGNTVKTGISDLLPLAYVEPGK